MFTIVLEVRMVEERELKVRVLYVIPPTTMVDWVAEVRFLAVVMPEAVILNMQLRVEDTPTSAGIFRVMYPLAGSWV